MPYKKNVCTHCRVYYDKMLPECPQCHGELFKQYNVTDKYRKVYASGESNSSSKDSYKRYGGCDNEKSSIGFDVFGGFRDRNGSKDTYEDDDLEEVQPKQERNILRRGSVEGVIHDLQSFDDDRRWGIVRLYDSIRFGTVLCSEGYSFSVADANGNDTDVVCYGVLSSRSAKIVNGATARVFGKENNSGILMARSILVNGSKVKLVLPPTRKNMSLLPIIILGIVIILLGAAVYFIPEIRNFVGIFLAMMIVAEVLFLCISPLRRLATSPIAIAVVGGLLTLLFCNVGGLGAVVGAYVNALVPAAIVLFAIVYLIKKLL